MEILPLHSKNNCPTTFLSSWLPLLLSFSLFASFSLSLGTVEHRTPVLPKAIPTFVLQSKPDMLYTILEMMSFSLFLRSQAVGSTHSSLTWVPAKLHARHNTTSEDSKQGHSVPALSSRETHVLAELITLTATEIILAHHWPSEMNISLSYSQGDVNGIFINWWPVDCY